MKYSNLLSGQMNNAKQKFLNQTSICINQFWWLITYDFSSNTIDNN